jgi:outer membrane protein
MTRLPFILTISALLGLYSLQASWTLDETISYALEHNPDIQMAQAAIDAANSKVEQVKAAFRPQLNLETSYMRTNLPMNAFGSILNQGVFDFGLDFNNPGMVDNLNLTGSVQYSLYEGGARDAQLKASKSSRIASEHQGDAVNQQIKFAVIRTWNQIVQAKEHLKSQESNVNALSGSLQVAQQQYEAGKFLKTEVLNLEVQLAQAREAMVSAQLSLELSYQGLLNLLGSKDTSLLLSIQPEQENLYASIDFDSIQPTERAEWLAAKAQEQSSAQNLKAVQAGKTPKVNAFANYQYNKGWEMDGDGDHWMAGVALSYNIYGGGLTRNRIREAEAMYRQAQDYLRKVELAIDLEQRSTRIAYTNALQSVSVTSKMVEQAEESANLYRKRFESGVILSSELIDVENRLTEARMRRTYSKTQLNIARANLLRAFGHL